MLKYVLIVLILLPGVTHADLVDDLARRPDTLAAKLSPQGDYIAVLREEGAKRVVAVFEFPAMELVNVVDFPGRNEVGDYWWVNDERLLFSVAVDWGNREEDLIYGELYGVNADGRKGQYLFGIRGDSGRSGQSRTQRVRTSFAGATLTSPVWEDPDHVLITTYDFSLGYENPTTAMRLNVYSGQQSDVVRAPRPNARLIADETGEVRFSFHIDDDQVSVVHLRNPRTGEWREFSKAAFGESSLEPVTVRDDGSIYVYRSEGDGPRGLYLMDPDGKTFERLVQHDVVDVDSVLGRFGNVYGALLQPGKPELAVFDQDHPMAGLVTRLQGAIPEGVLLPVSGTHDERYFVFRLVSDVRTPEFYLYDNTENQLRMLFDTRPWIEDDSLSPMTPISFDARDGTPLYGYLTIPKGAEAEDLPLVVVPHGGPHGPRDKWGFGWENFIPASGYALLQINYRGSGGYGKGFERAGFREWSGKIQDDITDGVQWAIAEGIADPDRVCISGWSFGGYSAVMSIIREPKLYQCSVAGAGVYDQKVQYEDADFATLTRWGKRYLDRVIGEDDEALDAASPVTYVEQIKTPLLLIHGDLDARVPIKHAYELRKAMRDAGVAEPELVVLEGEAHSPRNGKNIQTWYRRTVEFLEDHIGPGVKNRG